MASIKKIIWFSHDGNLSGANICLLEYLKILRDSKFECYLVVPFMNEMAEKVEELGVKVFLIRNYGWASPKNAPFKYLTYKYFFRNFYARVQIYFLFKKLKPDYVATNTIVVHLAAYMAKKLSLKHVWFVHEFGEEDHGFTIAGSFARGAKMMNTLSEKIVFNSNIIQEKFKPFVPEDKRRMVFYPILVPFNNDITFNNSNNFKILMIGQIAPSKNILEALKALHICLQEGFMFCFSIVGKAEDLDYLSSLKDYIRENSMEEYVTFKGPTNNPFKFFRENHVLLMCSNKEAFGRVTVEALKSGIPVIGSNTGGTLEIIDDGINGYFYQSGDPADLAKKIIQLSNQYAHFNHNQIARLAGDRFNEKNTLNQLCEVFN